jgi:hypothetical protein
VGTSSAASIHSAELLANAATATNTADMIVKRDSSGNFSAGTITADVNGTVTGAASLNVLKSGDTMTGQLKIPSGSATTPALAFSTGSGTGIYSPSNNVLNLTASGIDVVNMSNSGVMINKALTTQMNVANSYAATSSTNPYPGTSFNTPLTLLNGAYSDNSTNIIRFNSMNQSGTSQNAYVGTVSNTANYTPTIVLGQQTGATAYTERLRIDSAGNVGIGTTAPSEKLEVNGNIKGTQLCIGTDCRSAWPALGGGGTVTSVGTGAGLLGGPITGSGTLSVDVGTSANQIVQLDSSAKLPAVDGSALTNLNATSLASGTVPAARMPALTGDVTTTTGSTATTLAQIHGKNIVITTPISGDLLKYNGTSWTNGPLSSADLSDSSSLIKSSQMPANCTAGQTLTFSSPTGSWICSSIVVTASNFSSQTQNTFLAAPNGSTGTPTFRAIASADLPSGTLSGSGTAGYVPYYSGASTLANSVIYQNGGNVGIGTTAPRAPLEVMPTLTGGQWNTVAIYGSDISYGGGLSIRSYRDGATPANRLVALQASEASNASTIPTGSPHDLLLQPDGGSVGIGTSTPTSRLSVQSGGSQGAGFFTSAITGSPTPSIYGISSVTQYTDMGNATQITGARSFVSNTSTGTIVTAIALDGTVSSGGGSITYGYGARINSVTATNYGYGVNIGTISAANKWSLYASDSTAPSYFAGKVGIGTDSPAYTLHVNGSVAGTSSYNNLSDRRLKENIVPLENSLEKILSLRGVSFDWRKKEYPSMNFDRLHDIGVIAQEVETVFPEAVTNGSDGFKTVAYAKLVAPLIQSTKELYGLCQASQSQMDRLDQSIKDHDRRISSLEEDNQRLKQENAQIKSYLCAKDPAAPFCAAP